MDWLIKSSMASNILSKVCIIIPVHNRIQYTLECIKSIYLQSYKKINVIVVDDGSEDSSSDIIRQEFPQINILHGNGNLWWTGAMSKGVNEILNNYNEKIDYILSLNNDTVLARNTIEVLVDHIKRLKGKVIVGALSVNFSDQDTVLSSGYNITSWFFNRTKYPHLNSRISNVPKEITPVDVLPGRCTLFPRRIFTEIGNYDAINFPHYNGDTEFTIRAKYKGWKLFIVPSAIVYEHQGETGLNPTFRTLNIKELFQSFFSIKSNNNIKIKTRFVFKVVPLYAKPTYLLFSYLKILIGSFIVVFNVLAGDKELK
jgi:GT2 family glycosyltransferase